MLYGHFDCVCMQSFLLIHSIPFYTVIFYHVYAFLITLFIYKDSAGSGL